MENPFHNFDPYDILEELAKQNKTLHGQFLLIVNNQRLLSESMHEQSERLKTQALMIQHLNNKINILIGELNEKENHSRPTR